MSKYRRKQFAFDFDTNKMKELGVYTNGYDRVERAFKKVGVEHSQGSVYVSKEGMSKYEAFDLVTKIGAKEPWIKACLKKLSITIAPKDHDVTEAFLTSLAEVETAQHKETTQEETKQQTLADQLLWVLENCRERIAEDIAANRSRQVGQVQQVEQVRQVGQGKSAASRKTRSK